MMELKPPKRKRKKVSADTSDVSNGPIHTIHIYWLSKYLVVLKVLNLNYLKVDI